MVLRRTSFSYTRYVRKSLTDRISREDPFVYRQQRFRTTNRRERVTV